MTDVGAGKAFYGGLFGWRFDGLVATLDGLDVASVGDAGVRPGGVGDVRRRRRRRRHDASDGGPRRRAGRPAGGRRRGRTRGHRSATRRARRSGCGRRAMRLGAQLTNSPGAWNFSDLHTADPPRQRASTNGSSAGGWSTRAGGWRSRCPGTATTSRPRSTPTSAPARRSAPEGFEDVIGGLAPAEEGEPTHWHVTFTVADRDASADLWRSSAARCCARVRTTGPATHSSATRRARRSRSASSPRRSGRSRPTTISS